MFINDYPHLDIKSYNKKYIFIDTFLYSSCFMRQYISVVNCKIGFLSATHAPNFVISFLFIDAQEISLRSHAKY